MALSLRPARGTNVTPVSQSIAAILSRTPDLFDREIGVARHAAAAIDERLRAAPVGLSAALDRGFRDRELHRRLGLNFISLHPAQLARLDALGPLRATALAIASLVRSGHVREAAVRGLCEHDDPVVLAFLLNRLNDYVGGIARIAWAGLELRLRPSHAALFVRCLPLLDRMNLWVRADVARREQLHEFLLRPDCRRALWDGLRDRDSEVCRHSAALLLRVHRGRLELQEVLAAALSARDPRTRRWAAKVAIDERCTPRAVLLALTPRLALDRAPAIRAVALEAHALQRDREGIARATFDTHASVRYRARAVLADRFEPLDYRGIALATRSTAEPARQALIAALATLSDFGRAEDIPLVAAYGEDPRPTVAREALRTLAGLRRI